MTPSKRLQNHFKKLSSFIEGHYSKAVLNSSSPKFNPFGGYYGSGSTSQGVKADLIYIYNPKNVKTKYYNNFAFVFNYENKEESEHTIKVQTKKNINKPHYNSEYENSESLKLNESIIESESFTIDDFKERMNTINSLFLEESLNNKLTKTFIFETLKNIFFEDGLNISEKRDRTRKNINEKKLKIEKEIEIEEKEVLILKQSLQKKTEEINLCVNSMDEIKQLEYFENKVRELKEKITRKKNNMVADNNLFEIKNNIKLKEDNLIQLKIRLLKK